LQLCIGDGMVVNRCFPGWWIASIVSFGSIAAIRSLDAENR
jgi:hypothetical protein